MLRISKYFKKIWEYFIGHLLVTTKICKTISVFTLCICNFYNYMIMHIQNAYVFLPFVVCWNCCYFFLFSMLDIKHEYSKCSELICE